MHELNKNLRAWLQRIDSKYSFNRVVHNTSYLIQTISLLVCAYYNYSTIRHGHVSPFEYKIRVAASAVIGLTGCFLMLRYLAQKDIK